MADSNQPSTSSHHLKQKEEDVITDSEADQIIKAVTAPVKTSSATVVKEVRKPGLWDQPSQRCPICMQFIDVRKENRVTIPCSEKNCEVQYHFECLAKNPWKNAKRCGVTEHCPLCFSKKISEKLEKKRQILIKKQMSIRIPETRYSQKKSVAALCGIVESKDGLIDSVRSRIISDDTETTERVNNMYSMIDGALLAEKHVSFENLVEIGYTLPMMCRDFDPIRTQDLLEMGFSSKTGLPEVIDQGAYLVEKVGMTPSIQRRIKIDIKKLKPSNPNADQMLTLGLHFGELLLLGFDKQHFAQFTLISQNDWIEKLGMSVDVFALLNVKFSDFQTGKPLAKFHPQTLIECYGLEDNLGRCVDLGLLEVKDRNSRSSSPDNSRPPPTIANTNSNSGVREVVYWKTK